MCFDKLMRKLNFNSPMLQRSTLFTTEIYAKLENFKGKNPTKIGQIILVSDFGGVHVKCIQNRVDTNGNAAQYFINVLIKCLRFF